MKHSESDLLSWPLGYLRIMLVLWCPICQVRHWGGLFGRIRVSDFFLCSSGPACRLESCDVSRTTTQRECRSKARQWANLQPRGVILSKNA